MKREHTSRPYKLSHQELVITGIDFLRRSLMGYTELTIYPLSKMNKVVLNSRQCRITRVCINGSVDVAFVEDDKQLHVCPADTKKRSLDYFASCHQQALNSTHVDLGGTGELSIILTKEAQNLFQERKPVRILIEFFLEKPQGGLHFVVPGGEGTYAERGCHLFTYGHGNTSRLWFPCVDVLSELCTWSFEITVDSSLVAIGCGELMGIVLSEDERRKTYSFQLNVPTSAVNIALVVGGFEIVPDPKTPEMTFFCPPGLSPLLKHSTAFLHEAFSLYLDLLNTRFPYTSYKQVFVNESYVDIASYASLTIISIDLLHSRRMIEQTFVTRQQLSLALARQYFGCFLCPKTWSDAWLSAGCAAFLQGLFQRKMFGNSHYRYFLKEEMDHVCQHESDGGGLPPLQPRSPSAAAAATIAENGRGMTPPPDSLSSSPAPSLHPHVISGGASAWSSSTAGRDRVALEDSHMKKAHLIMHMTANQIGEDCLMQVFNKLLTLASSASDQSVTAGTWYHILLTTDAFVRIMSTVSGKSMAIFMSQWVWQSGIVNFHAKFSFNRKRNAVELRLRQEISRSSKHYLGPLVVSVQELDGCFPHTIQVDGSDKTYELPCHSKARRTKKRKIQLANGEEAEMDLNLMDPDSPVLWVRLDPDMAWLRRVHLEQADYMWQLQLIHDRDVLGQIEACTGIVHFPSQNTRKILTDAIMNQKFYYRVRCCAAQSLAQVAIACADSWSGATAMIQLFRQLFGSHSCSAIVRLNDFSNFAEYFVQKELPLAISKVRSVHGRCPPEVVSFLTELLKFNDNRSNKFSDSCYLKELVQSLVHTLTPAVSVAQTTVATSSASSAAGGATSTSTTAVGANAVASSTAVAPGVAEAHTVILEVAHQLNHERFLPSYQLLVTQTCLGALRTLQGHGHVIPDAAVFRHHAQYGLFTEVRLAALQAAVQYLRAEKDEETLSWLLDLVESDPVPSVRLKIVRMMVSCPPFTRKVDSPLNQITLVNRLWHVMTVKSSCDSQLRRSLAELYEVLYGRLTPNCVPAQGLGVVIDLKERKARSSVASLSTEADPSAAVAVSDSGAESDSLRLTIKIGSRSANSHPGTPPAEVAQAVVHTNAVEAIPEPVGPTPAPATSSHPAAVLQHGVSRKRPREGGDESGHRPHKKHKKEKHRHKHKHKHRHHHGDAMPTTSIAPPLFGGGDDLEYAHTGQAMTEDFHPLGFTEMTQSELQPSFMSPSHPFSYPTEQILNDDFDAELIVN